MVAGIDLGHRHVRVAVADLAGSVVAERAAELDVDSSPAGALEGVEELLRSALLEARTELEALRAVVSSVPGPLVASDGTIGSRSLMPRWNGVVLADELAGRLGRAVAVHNDANLGALGELAFGAAAGLEHFVYVKLGFGMGAGIVLDGRLYTGARGMAGELGHVIVQENGPVCACGNRGCLAATVSLRRVLELLQPAHAEPLGLADLLDLLADGDAGARRIVYDTGRSVGAALGDLANCIDPEGVILGGTLGELGQPIIDGVRAGLDAHAQPAIAGGIDVRQAALGARSEVMGAVALGMSQLTPRAPAP
nr:ROK family protein [Motilibacter deserti]